MKTAAAAKADSDTRADLVVLWRVTEACDLACPFCAYSRALPHEGREAEPSVLFRLGPILREYSSRFRCNVLLSFLGGEPLLWSAWHRVAAFMSADCGLRVSLTTNGTALASATVRRRVTESLDELVLSVDGLPAFHDLLRGAPGLSAKLAEAVRDLRRRRHEDGRGPRLAVNTILMRDNVRQFGALCRMLAEWGIEVLTFNQLGGRERPEFHAGHQLTPDDVQCFFRELPAMRQEMAAAGLDIRGSESYLTRIRASAHSVRVPVEDCRPGMEFLFVDEDGTVSPCSQVRDSCRMSIDDVRDVDDLAYLQAWLAELRALVRPAACGDCHSTQHFGKFRVTASASGNGAPHQKARGE